MTQTCFKDIGASTTATGFEGIQLGVRCRVCRGRKNDEESKSWKTHCWFNQPEGVRNAHLRPVGSFYNFL